MYAVCDADVCERLGWGIEDFADACLRGGARVLQIRAKRLAAGRLLETARRVVERAATVGALVIVNDRPDVARLAGAAGVHVGQDDLDPRAVRAVAGTGMVIGLSTHTAAQIDRALDAPIDYVAVGPVFGTETKETGYPPLELERLGVLAARAAASGTPVVAIGGITLANARKVRAAGAASVAVISDLLATGDPAARVAEYLAALS